MTSARRNARRVLRKAEAGSEQARCPICRRPVDSAWRPFCSKRCADLDLSRWLTGAYAIPGVPLGQGGEPAAGEEEEAAGEERALASPSGLARRS